MSLNRPQPQVEITVTATLSDPDDAEGNDADDLTGTTWQWQRSMDMQDWADITGETDDKYTPVVADEGYYLRATATYTDTHMEGQTATSDASEYSVEPETSANAVPDFGKEDEDDDKDDPNGEEEDGLTEDTAFMRSVVENTAAETNIGNPVKATDDDTDLLVYTLSDSANAEGDAAKFDIDDRSGQIKVKTVLDFEAANDADNADEDNDDVFEVVVTATDPSEATMTAEVRITVTDVNEAPTFADDAPTKLRIAENQATILVDDGTDDGGNLDDYTATDEDAGDTMTYSLGGDDASSFAINDTSAVLTFPDTAGPNFEDKNSYSIIIKVTDVDADDDAHVALTTELPVTVGVRNAEEAGEVTFDRVQPQVGVEVTASLSDVDLGITGTTWQWYRGAGTIDDEPDMCSADSPSPPCAIDDATSNAYTPGDDDQGAIPARQGDLQRQRHCRRRRPGHDGEDESVEMATGAFDSETTVAEKTTGNAAPEFAEVKANEEDGTPMQDGTADNPFMRSVGRGHGFRYERRQPGRRH